MFILLFSFSTPVLLQIAKGTHVSGMREQHFVNYVFPVCEVPIVSAIFSNSAL